VSPVHGALPPRLARTALELFLPRGIRGEAILGDLDEEFQGICRDRTRAEAGAWYRRQALRVIVGYRLLGLLDPSRRGVGGAESGGALQSGYATVLDDARFALRRFAKAPAFTAVAVITIAIGIGANTAVFSVVDAVMLRPLPYPNADRIVQVWQTNPDYRAERSLPYDDFSFNALDYVEYERETRVFDEMGFALRYADEGFGTLDLGDGPPESVGAWGVSSSFFDVLGMPPVLGRAFTAEETAPQGEMRWTPVVILSHDLWMRRFEGDPGVVGREIRFESAPATVVGVLPEGFQFPVLSFMGAVAAPDVDIFVPLYYQALYQPQQPGRFRQFLVTARLREGVSVEEADSDLARVAASLAVAHPETHTGWRPIAKPLREIAGRGFETQLLALMAAVGFVLLIACANVANLLLAQGATRRSEMAVRSAIGGGRRHLVQLLLTESILLASTGGALGVALGQWGTRTLVRLVPADMPGGGDAGLNASVLLFAVGLTLLTGVVFGLLPALRGSMLNLVSDLRGGRGEAGARGEWRLSRVLLAAQVAITVILLVGGGVLGKSFLGLNSQPLGYDPENVLVASLVQGAHHPLRVINPADSAQRQALWQRKYDLLERLSAIPGVVSVAEGHPPLKPRGGYFPVQFTEEGEDRAERDLTELLRHDGHSHRAWRRAPAQGRRERLEALLVGHGLQRSDPPVLQGTGERNVRRTGLAG
jgi:putative ABC transport system permease protein